jgi:ubiquinone biosynthesis protein Coq4
MKDQLIEKMYEWSKKPYQRFFKNKIAWEISKQELLSYSNETLGYHLGQFLQKNNFDIQPKLEDHDIIHVLTNTGISVREEIGMQYYLLGNGKNSLYLYLVILAGTLFYPTHINYFIKEFRKGKKAHHFHDLDFSKMLLIPIETIQLTFKI